jgi:hypothetical protein
MTDVQEPRQSLRNEGTILNPMDFQAITKPQESQKSVVDVLSKPKVENADCAPELVHDSTCEAQADDSLRALKGALRSSESGAQANEYSWALVDALRPNESEAQADDSFRALVDASRPETGTQATDSSNAPVEEWRPNLSLTPVTD